jgi:DNA-directed RNA polymerase III subunit RPC6
MGGPFFTDQALDTTFVDTLRAITYDIIKDKSTASTAKQRKGSATGSSGRRAPGKVIQGQKNAAPTSAMTSKKRTADQMRAGEGPSDKAALPATSTVLKQNSLVVMPANYKHFPTIADITEVLANAKIADTVLDEEQVQNLVTSLMWDNMVEPVTVGDRNGWRVTRASKQSVERWFTKMQQQTPGDIEDARPTPFKNEVEDAPCFNCPVAHLCEPSAAVSPQTCEYFSTYLGLDAPIDEGS